MSKNKVLFIGNIPPRYLKTLVDAAPEGFSVVRLPNAASLDEMVREVKDADFLILRHGTTGIPDEVFRAGKRVKLVQITGMGFDWLPLPLLKELGIGAANVGGMNAVAVAEHAVTLMLTVLRRLVPSMAALRQGKWRKDLDDSLCGELYLRTVGVVGLGNIGRWVAKIVAGFGARVIFYDSIKMTLTAAAVIPARQVTLEELLRTADIVSLHVPLSGESKKLIGRHELELMKPSAILINASRGEVVDEAALIEALRENRIAGAGLDVFEHEPVDLKSPLLQMEQVVCTPHMGGAAWENIPRRVSRFWENFEAVLRGERPATLVADGSRLSHGASKGSEKGNS
jgi:phosphoglycerate dehydrogenase-like enzyme